MEIADKTSSPRHRPTSRNQAMIEKDLCRVKKDVRNKTK
jgi:hypothetical protein